MEEWKHRFLQIIIVSPTPGPSGCQGIISPTPSPQWWMSETRKNVHFYMQRFKAFAPEWRCTTQTRLHGPVSWRTVPESFLSNPGALKRNSWKGGTHLLVFYRPFPVQPYNCRCAEGMPESFICYRPDHRGYIINNWCLATELIYYYTAHFYTQFSLSHHIFISSFILKYQDKLSSSQMDDCQDLIVPQQGRADLKLVDT